MSIDPSQVENIYTASLAEDLSPDSEHYLLIEGIVHTTAFDRRKLVTYTDRVAEMLSWLPMNYRPPQAGGGGGWTFLNACFDKDDHQWTGLHWIMEMLFQLGIGLGMANWLGPRELWSAFPGGMPYVAVTLPEDAAA